MIHPFMTDKLVAAYLANNKREPGDDSFIRLSARERHVLALIAEGRSSGEIGEALSISPYTVQTYRQRIMNKLDIVSAADLLRYAARRGAINLE